MWTFYGLSEKYIEHVYEQMFQLKYHGGWSFFEVYNLPVMIRGWFLRRLIDQKQEEADNASPTASSSPSGRGRSYKP